MDENTDDLKIESEIEVEEEERGEERAETKIAKLREELSACRKEKQEYMDGWQRAKADYVNLLKRLESEAKSAELLGKIKAIETLLPAFDALERAKEHLPSEALAKEGGEIPAGFLAIAKQLEGAFAALGLQEMGKVGEPFDPGIHEAFGQDAVDTPEREDAVTAVLEKGWRINGTVIRPAKVRVGHYQP